MQSSRAKLERRNVLIESRADMGDSTAGNRDNIGVKGNDTSGGSRCTRVYRAPTHNSCIANRKGMESGRGKGATHLRGVEPQRDHVRLGQPGVLRLRRAHKVVETHPPWCVEPGKRSRLLPQLHLFCRRDHDVLFENPALEQSPIRPAVPFQPVLER
eukprot:scaffold13716_cov122-Isochrysis_galbana.AAC.4